MKSVATDEFRDRLGRLPGPVRQQASRTYALWRADPHHPGLQFKRIAPQPIRWYPLVSQSGTLPD